MNDLFTDLSQFRVREMDIVVINVVIVGRNDKIFQSGNRFPETIGDISVIKNSSVIKYRNMLSVFKKF